MGILKNIGVTIAGLTFTISLVAMDMVEVGVDYNMMLGRHWLCQAKVKQDWEHDQLTIRKGKFNVHYKLRQGHHLDPTVKPVVAETVNMTKGLEEDEKEAFLKPNADLVILCVVDVLNIQQEYQAKGNNETIEEESLELKMEDIIVQEK